MFTIILITPAWQSQPWYSNEQKKSNSNPQNRRTCDKQDTAIGGLGSFLEKLSAEGLSEQTISRLSDARRKGNQSL